MPKIKAPTVPQHRDAQRAAILKAARELVLAGGPTALKFGEIAARTGLARSSIYEYFGSKVDLVEALIASEVPGWKADLQEALARAVDPQDAIRFFLETQLKMIADGRHELPFAVAGTDAQDASEPRIAEVHREIFGLLVPALTALGIRKQEACLELVAAVLHAAASKLRHGSTTQRTTIATTVSFVTGGILALARGEAAKQRGRAV
jgi:AcrR family transcriptional regulator